MKRLFSLLSWDFKLQFKYGFYFVVIPLCGLYIFILQQFSRKIINYTAPFIVFSDPALLGMIFIGAMLYFERTQGTLQAFVVSPVRLWEYFFSKLFTFAIMGLISGFIIIFSTYGFKFNYLFFILGMLLCSAFFTLVGIILITRIPGITEFFLAVIPVLIVLCIPIIGSLGIVKIHIWYLFPSYAFIMLIRAGFIKVSTPNLIYALTYSIVSIVVVYILARKEFTKNIIEKKGAM